MKENPWNDERRALLERWWLEEGKGSPEIVKLFAATGFVTSRNSVIGMVHRADWWQGKSRLKKPPKPRGTKKKRSLEAASKSEPPPPPPVKLRTPPQPPPPEPRLGQPMYLSVIQIGYGQCRFWYGDSRGLAGSQHETGYCGQKAAKGPRGETLSWCPAHMRLVYSRVPPQSRISIAHKF